MLMGDLLRKEGGSIADDDGLVAASQGGLLRVVSSYLMKGPITNTQGALDAACAGGFTKVVQTLLENGADVAQRDKNGWTALHSAADGGHTDVSLLLLKHGARAEGKDKYGATALCLAVRNGQ